MAVHFWPASAVAHATMQSAARSRSASASTTAGLSPLNSSATRANRGAASAASARPPASEPVKCRPATRASATSAAAVSGPPGSTCSTGSGTPARCRSAAAASAVAVARSDGFQTTALPAISAGSHFQAGVISGTFQGVTAAMTPSGRRSTRAPPAESRARRVGRVPAGRPDRPLHLAGGVGPALADLVHEQVREL